MNHGLHGSHGWEMDRESSILIREIRGKNLLRKERCHGMALRGAGLSQGTVRKSMVLKCRFVCGG
jgi:hypothetical protein